MKAFKKTRGSVSIFLVIILVPCLLASSIFVDIGRVSLSKSTAKSASDLALNTLLTKYDYDLKDFYGLAASCQTIDEFYGVATDYFTRTISSQDLSDEEIVLLSDYFSSSLAAAAGTSPTISDYLKTDVTVSATVEAVPGANMANATFIKDGIIEFMKYRAPLGIVNNLFLKEFINSKDALEDAEEDKKVIDAKEDYYEAEQDFNEVAKQIYEQVKEYNNLNITTSDLENIINDVNCYEDLYKEMHNIFVHDLSNTSGIMVLNRTYYNHTSYPIYTYYDNGTGLEEDQNLATEDDLILLMKELILAIDAYIKAKVALEDVFLTYSAGNGDSNTYDIQYWAQSYSSVNSKLSTLNSKAIAMMKKYNAVENALAFLYADDIISFESTTAPRKWVTGSNIYNSYEDYDTLLTTKQHYTNIKAMYESVYTTYICTVTTDENNADKYIKYMSILERISNDANNQKAINASTNKLPSTGQSVATTVTDIYNNLIAFRTEILDYKSRLEAIVDNLELLKTKNNTYNSTFDSWSEMVQDEETDLETSDKAEIDSEIADNMDDVDDASIDAMIERVNSIIAKYDYIISVIDGLKYGSTNLTSITNVSDAILASGISTSALGLTNGQLNTYANDTFSFTKYNNVDASISFDDSNHPNLAHDPKPELFKWMEEQDWDTEYTGSTECTKCHKMFDNSEYGNVSDEYLKDEKIKVDKTVCPKCSYGDGDDSGYDKKAENSGTYSGTDSSDASGDIKAQYESIKTQFPSGFSKDAVGLLDSIAGIFDVTGDMIDNFGLGGEDVRDALYTSEYVFGMFSHYTFDKEGKYSLIKKELQAGTNELELGTTLDAFYKADNSTISGYYSETKVQEKWADDDVTFTENKSFTNKMIDKNNNFAYGGEIEYILQGGKNNDNLNSIMGSIYATRFLTNSIAGFSTFWNVASIDPDGPNKNTGELLAKAGSYQAIAAAVSAATLGVVPEPLVKAALILIEIGIETALDIQYLKAGMPVKFIKGKCDENWGILRTISYNVTTKDITGFYIQYSNYLYVFLITGLCNDSCKDDIYTRIGDVIQANMMKVTENGDYRLSKSITHFKINSTLRVQPLMLNLPIYSQYEGDMSNLFANLDWCTYNITTTRGY